jgi:hypothetical protein
MSWYLANSSSSSVFPSLSAENLRRTAMAWSSLSFSINHLGLSGSQGDPASNSKGAID